VKALPLEVMDLEAEEGTCRPAAANAEGGRVLLGDLMDEEDEEGIKEGEEAELETVMAAGCSEAVEKDLMDEGEG